MKLIHFITSLERGGAQAVLYNMVCSLRKDGYDQVIIYVHGGYYEQLLKDLGMLIYRVQGACYFFDPLGIYRLYKVLKQQKPDCLHTMLWAANWMGRLVARLLAIPCIVSLHNNYDQNGWLRIVLDYCVLFNSTKIIAVSAEVRQSFYEYQKTIAQVQVIQNGIDTELLQGASQVTRESIGYASHHFIIGSVGRFQPVKRYPLLLDAFAQVYKKYQHARLLVIGAGPEEDNLRAKAKQLGIHDYIYWAIDVSAHHYYSLMDCFVLSSEKEGISMALLEAMSHATPCVVTNPSWEHPVLDHMKNGVIVRAHNAFNIARKIEKLIIHRPLRIKLGLQAKKTINTSFTHDHMMYAYKNVFQTIFSFKK